MKTPNRGSDATLTIGSAFSPMQKASRLNAYAAGFAGVSALLQANLMILPE